MLSLYTNLMIRLRSEEKGATAVEYGIMVALIAVVIIVAVSTPGRHAGRLFFEVSVNTATSAPPARDSRPTPCRRSRYTPSVRCRRRTCTAQAVAAAPSRRHCFSTIDRKGAPMSQGSERGAVAVEFAILLPLLSDACLGTIEFGRAYNAQITLTNAARDGVRVMAIANDPAGARTAAKNAAAAAQPSASLDSDVTLQHQPLAPPAPGDAHHQVHPVHHHWDRRTIRDDRQRSHAMRRLTAGGDPPKKAAASASSWPS